MVKFNAQFLPKRTFLRSEAVQVVLEDRSISVISKKSKSVLFTSSLNDLQIGEDPEIAWTILKSHESIARIMFSDIRKIKITAYLIAAIIIIAIFEKANYLIGLVLVFLIFRPWLRRQENNSEVKRDFLRQLISNKNFKNIQPNQAAVDDMTVGTNKIFGGWREKLTIALITFFGSLITTITYFIGIYGADRRPGNLFLVVWGGTIIVYLIYYTAITRKTSVEYYKMKRSEKNKFTKFLLLFIAPPILISLILIIIPVK